MINIKQIEKIKQRRSFSGLSLQRRASTFSTVNNHHHYNQNDVAVNKSKEVMVVDAKRRFSNLRLGKDNQMNQNARGRRSFSEALVRKDDVQKSSAPSLFVIPKDKRPEKLLPNLTSKMKTTLLSIKDPPKSRTLKLSRFNTKEQQPPSKQPPYNILIQQPPIKPQINLQLLYTKTTTSYNKQQNLWDYHLKQQLSLQQAIQQLQKIELDRNLHPSRKLTMRQAYQLKKQIVSEIEKQQSAELIRSNIQRLSEIAFDENEREKCLTIGLFVTLREMLRSTTSQGQFTFSPIAINQLKQHLPQYQPRNAQQPNIITTKILSILSLHIMKLQSPTFTQEDIKLINSAIQMKIKVHSMIDHSFEQKRYHHLQQLIYIIFQFYKILFYLKLNQELKIHQYALLQAYLTIYKESNPIKYELFEQNYCIGKIISIIKPFTADIYPYQDTRGRIEANHLMLKYQIHNAEKIQDNNTIMRVKRLQHSMRGTIFVRASEKEQVSDSSNPYSESFFHEPALQNNQQQSKKQIVKNQPTTENAALTKSTTNIGKSILKNKPKLELAKELVGKATAKVLKLSLSHRYQSMFFNQDQQQSLGQLENTVNLKRFSFPFLLLKQQQIYHGQFAITLSQSQPKNVNLRIHVTDPNGFYLTFFNCNGIKTYNEQLTKENFQKIIWKIFKQIFVTKYMQQQDPFLMKQPITDLEHVQNYFPQECQELQDCQIIEILHAYIVYWLRMREFCYSFNGKILLKPQFQLAEVNKYMQYLQYERDRKLFQKRQGFLIPSSGRKTSLMPTNIHPPSKLYFNPILQDFTIIPHESPPSHQHQQLNIFLLTKLTLFQKSQFNFIHLVFHNQLRQMNIFQFGTYKHFLTSLINDKIKMMRKIIICERHSKQKLIYIIERVLTSYINNTSRNSRKNRLSHQSSVSNNINLYQKYRIEQQFQLDLTNQFKFIPSLNMKLIVKRRTKGQQRRSSLDNLGQLVLGGGIDSFAKVGKKKKKNKQIKRPSSFKVENEVFLTFAQQFPWGKKLFSFAQCLQFFQLNNNPQHFYYSLQCISLYKLGLILDQKIHQYITEDGKQYNFYNVKKPFLSKAQTQPQAQSEDKFNSEERDFFTNNHEQVKTHENPIHFLESRIFFTLKYQKILKFKTNNNITYFSFQTYKQIQQQFSLNDEYSFSQAQPLFIYQLTNLHQPHIKFYLLTTKTINHQITTSQSIAQLISIQQPTLMGEIMQPFTLPISRMTFTNEFNESRTKNVRKKVVSEANQYFQEKILQADNKIGMETLLLNILQSYHAKTGARHKMNYQIDEELIQHQSQHQQLAQSQESFGLQ